MLTVNLKVSVKIVTETHPRLVELFFSFRCFYCLYLLQVHVFSQVTVVGHCISYGVYQSFALP